ncbi:hypothetical protein NMY22_g2521 [Coprinellus aureogranulatus]|nr:hypothetical protein NMY22_g2521 [Coprinellus aureogranulatus]
MAWMGRAGDPVPVEARNGTTFFPKLHGPNSSSSHRSSVKVDQDSSRTWQPCHTLRMLQSAVAAGGELALLKNELHHVQTITGTRRSNNIWGPVGTDASTHWRFASIFEEYHEVPAPTNRSSHALPCFIVLCGRFATLARTAVPMNIRPPDSGRAPQLRPSCGISESRIMAFDPSAELNALFDRLSLLPSEPLCNKFHYIVKELFEDDPNFEVPPLEWFRDVVPPEDMASITYLALAHLEDIAIDRSHILELVRNEPLAFHIRAAFFQGAIASCADHMESILDKPKPGCRVCQWREASGVAQQKDPYCASGLTDEEVLSYAIHIDLDASAYNHVPEERLKDIQETLELGDVCRRLANFYMNDINAGVPPLEWFSTFVPPGDTVDVAIYALNGTTTTLSLATSI